MEIYLLLIFMICAGIVALETKDLISSLIALSAGGLALSLAFLVLKAPNLAITQLVVEILCIIILIRGTISKDIPLVRDGRWLFNTVSTFVFIGFFLMVAYFALKELPRFGEPIMKVSGEYITAGAQNPHPANIVTAIISSFRNYDTLGLAAILFTAMIGVLAITRKVGRTDEK